MNDFVKNVLDMVHAFNTKDMAASLRALGKVLQDSADLYDAFKNGNSEEVKVKLMAVQASDTKITPADVMAIFQMIMSIWEMFRKKKEGA